jgi:DNA modification methylase
MSSHKIFYKAAQDMSDLSDDSVNLVVTSPPYPMIEMWDEIMMAQNSKIKTAFEAEQFQTVYELMHQELDKVWSECYRVLKEGGIACINIGDATRTLNKNFALYPNHSRIIQNCLQVGFQNLPNIIWRKQTNAPNKFMGSGMLPPGAYVTLEHEFILIFRKGRKREFKTLEDKANRNKSAYFWEERNIWFSDLWDFKGTTQKLMDKATRQRSAAYPFELPYRLINMFSVQGDVVLDPFLGTGTTSLAAMVLNRNSIGFEIDKNLKSTISEHFLNQESILNSVAENRLAKHLQFVKDRKASRGEDAFKYVNEVYEFPVLTRQEKNLEFRLIKSITQKADKFEVEYLDKSIE